MVMIISLKYNYWSVFVKDDKYWSLYIIRFNSTH